MHGLKSITSHSTPTLNSLLCQAPARAPLFFGRVRAAGGAHRAFRCNSQPPAPLPRQSCRFALHHLSVGSSFPLQSLAPSKACAPFSNPPPPTQSPVPFEPPTASFVLFFCCPKTHKKRKSFFKKTSFLALIMIERV